MSSDAARRSDLSTLHPIVREAVKRVIEQLKDENLQFEVFEAFRTPERQKMLYAQGRTTPGDIVTKARPWTSYHQYGLAVDFVLRIDGTWSWASKGKYSKWWERLHAIARANNLEPLSWELPHLQYSGTSIEKLRRGDYPSLGDEDWAENLAAVIAGWTGSEDAPPPPTEIARRPAIAQATTSDDPDEETFGSTSSPAEDQVIEQPKVGLTSAVITAAQASDRIWGVPASVTLAQFILESAGGKRMPPGSNNPFGIKAKDGEPFVSAQTWEVEKGKKIVTGARFRKFANFDEAFSHHGRLLATSPYYKKAMAVKNDPTAFANALTGVYATDPEYGRKLISLVKQYELGVYDKETPMPTMAVDGHSTSSVGVKSMTLRFGEKGETVRALQQMLKTAGYSVGAIDGAYGSLTRAAVAAFQADNSLPMTGEADAALMELLNKAPPRPLDRDRVNATEADLLKEGSTTVIEARRTKLVGWATGILGALGIGNSTVVTANGTNTTPVPALETFVAQVQSYVANPLSPESAIALAELKRETPLVAEALKTINSESLPSVIEKLQPLLAGQATVGSSQPVRTVFDMLAANLHGTPGLQSVFEVIASIAGSLVPGFGGSVVALGIGLLTHYFGSKISQSRVQEHREGSNLNR